MAEFSDANLWLKLAFLMTMLGFTCDLFAFALGISAGSDIEGAMIVGYLFLLTAVVMIVCLVFVDNLVGNKIALIFYIIFVLIAGLAIIIGFGIWGGKTALTVFSAAIGISGALLLIMAGIFGILEVVGLKPK